MQVTLSNDVKVYNLSAGKSLPEVSRSCQLLSKFVFAVDFRQKKAQARAEGCGHSPSHPAHSGLPDEQRQSLDMRFTRRPVYSGRRYEQDLRSHLSTGDLQAHTNQQ